MNQPDNDFGAMLDQYARDLPAEWKLPRINFSLHSSRTNETQLSQGEIEWYSTHGFTVVANKAIPETFNITGTPHISFHDLEEFLLWCDSALYEVQVPKPSLGPDKNQDGSLRIRRHLWLKDN